MITRDEIDDNATALDLPVANVERDYVFGWLISGLFQESRLGQSFVLKGGNALRKGYFPLTRFSDDLDFSTTGGVDAAHLIEQLNAVCCFVEARAGVSFELERNTIVAEQQIDRDKHVYKVRLYFKDFAGLGDHITLKVRVDVTEYDRLHLPVQNRHLIHQYSDAADCAAPIRVVKLEEALADKLKCLLQRRSCFDLFDTVYAIFVANELAVDHAEIMQVFLQKTIFRPAPSAAKQLLLGVPFDVLQGFWGKVACPLATRMTFAHAVATLQRGIEELFAPFGVGGWSERVFFPAELRNAILEAGSARTLLELRYDGVTRLVEPYALTFKRRQDGEASEYFYAYDQTGGQRSGPGIKSFLAPKVDSLRLTDRPFEPRFEIELAKAGDADAAGYFASTAGRRLIGARRYRQAATGPTHTVQCPYCGRHFTRKTASTTLRQHKDRYGNRCFGRVGQRVY